VTATQTVPEVFPHDFNAEAALIGCMMSGHDAIGTAMERLPAECNDWFYDPRHAVMFRLLCDLFDKGLPVDGVVVKNELGRRKQLEAAGGMAYIVDLAGAAAYWGHPDSYAKIVYDKAMLRRLIVAADQIKATANNAGDPVADILDDAERRLFAVTEQRVAGQGSTIADVAAEAFAAIEDRKAGELRGLPTGLMELDDLTQGLQAGDLVIVAARPSTGKTSLALNVAEFLAVDEGKPVAFFSMEMSRTDLAERILSARGKVDSNLLRSGRLGAQQIDALRSALGELKAAPLFIDDAAGMTVLELRAKARRLRAQQNVAAIFVDYLQLMRVGGKVESRQQEVSTISRGLKGLARELGIPVVVLAQLNRAVEGRDGHRPRLSDLRESGSIEQDADVVMLLHRPSMYGEAGQENVAEVIIAKHRNGPTGTVRLHFHPGTTRFSNLYTMAAMGQEEVQSPYESDASEPLF
jgi:replicative DNA helicase